jgi:hypothetical protein
MADKTLDSEMLGRIGFVLMSIGFLWGAFLIVKHPGMVEWGPYGMAFVITSLGAGLIRYAKRQTGGGEEKVTGDIDTIERSLGKLVASVRQMNEDKETADPFSFCTRIDEECMEDINDFVEARQALIVRHGLAHYAAVMDSFALGERAINRTWCASADGYIDEVKRCLQLALAHWETALDVAQNPVKAD